MLRRLRQYFRSGHVSMTPALSWSELFASWRPVAARPAAEPVDAAREVAYPVSLPARQCRYTYNGSAAIAAALQEMQLPCGEAVLLPAYCCGAELGPFAHRGCRMSFYDVEPDGTVSADRLLARLNASDDIRLVLVTHYNGIVQPQIQTIADICQAQGVSLIEDCAHALYSHLDGRAAGSWADHAVFSMRKSLPLSEGGALTVRTALRRESQNDSLAAPRLARLDRIVYSLQQHARTGVSGGLSAAARLGGICLCVLPAVLVKGLQRSRLVKEHYWLTPEVEGADAYPVYHWRMSAFSLRLLQHSNAGEVRARRRHNHSHWVELLRDLPGAEPMHPVLPEGACPLYFLVRVADPARCVRRLAERDIEAFNWWQHLSPQIVWSCFPVARQLKQSLLALPLHQKLSDADIMRMAVCLREVVAIDPAP